MIFLHYYKNLKKMRPDIKNKSCLIKFIPYKFSGGLHEALSIVIHIVDRCSSIKS